MSLPKIVSQEEWDAARRILLEKEKELTRQRDRLNTERRELPMVEVTKPYEFEGPGGTRSLLDLFEGRPQLIVYHFMFHPEWDDGCPSCSAGTDELSPRFIEHLRTKDTSYALVSRAPLAKLERWKTKKGWTIPWYSTNDGDFSYDFGATIDAAWGATTSTTTASSTSTPPVPPRRQYDVAGGVEWHSVEVSPDRVILARSGEEPAGGGNPIDT